MTGSVIQSQPDLLGLARSVLERASFKQTKAERVQGEPNGGEIEFFLAESRFFILAVTAITSVSDAPFVEAAISEVLGRRLRAQKLGAKKWDAYLVILVSERLPDLAGASRDIFDINYDLREVRRIVIAGVEPTVPRVEAALRPFLPLPEAAASELSIEALTLLEKELVSRGQPADLVGRAVAAFRESKDLSSV